MGHAVLLCPSTAVQLLGQVSPSKTSRPKIYSSPYDGGRHLLYAHWRGDFFRRSTNFWPNIAAQSRKKNARVSWRVFTVAVGEELSVDEPVAETTVEVESAPAEQPLKSAANGQDSHSSEVKTQRKRSAPRRDNRVRVANDALVSGATFTGKVTTIQSFGAFVDIGAFTNGLIHISRLSKAYVKSVEDVVQVGQEVNVQVLDADLQAKRISLMLKQDEQQQEGEGPTRSSDREGTGVQKGRNARRGESQRRNASSSAATNLKKGETATGVVKNIIKSGVFVTLPDGVDGFLPAIETDFGAANVNLEAHFKLGQELSVRVLRIERGRVRLTTKQAIDFAKINEYINKDVVGGATNPFEIAFRQNPLISSYLEEKQKLEDAAEGKGVKVEPDAGAKGVPDLEPSSRPPEEEVTEVPLDDKTDLSASVSVLEKAAEEGRVQGNEISQKSSEESAEDLHGKSLDLVADKDVDEKIPKLTESVDKAEVTKQALLEGVQTAVQDPALVEEVLAGQEAAIEGIAEAVGELATLAGGAATNEVVAATEEVLTPAEDTFDTREATGDEVVGDIEAVAPVEEAAGGSVVAVVEDSVAAFEKEVAKREITSPELVAPAEEVSSAAEGIVRHVEGVVAAVEEAVAVVEEAVAVLDKGLAEPEIAVQERVPPAEEAFGTGVSAGEEKLGDGDMAVAAVEGVVAAVEEAVAAVKEELAEQEPVKEPVASVKEAETDGEEEKRLISKEEEYELPLKAEKAPVESEAQKKVEEGQEIELSPDSQDSKVNKVVEDPAVQVKEPSQETAELEALEVVGVSKQDN